MSQMRPGTPLTVVGMHACMEAEVGVESLGQMMILCVQVLVSIQSLILVPDPYFNGKPPFHKQAIAGVRSASAHFNLLATAVLSRPIECSGSACQAFLKQLHCSIVADGILWCRAWI